MIRIVTKITLLGTLLGNLLCLGRPELPPDAEPLRDEGNFVTFILDGKKYMLFEAAKAYFTHNRTRSGRNYTLDNRVSIVRTEEGPVALIHDGIHRAVGTANGDIIPVDDGGTPEPGWLIYSYDEQVLDLDHGWTRVADLSIDYNQPEVPGRALRKAETKPPSFPAQARSREIFIGLPPHTSFAPVKTLSNGDPNPHYAAELTAQQQFYSDTPPVDRSVVSRPARSFYESANSVLLVPDRHPSAKPGNKMEELVNSGKVDWIALEMLPYTLQPVVNQYLDAALGSKDFLEAESRLKQHFKKEWNYARQGEPESENKFFKIIHAARNKGIRIYAVSETDRNQDSLDQGVMARGNALWASKIPSDGHGAVFAGWAHFYGASNTNIQDFLALAGADNILMLNSGVQSHFRWTYKFKNYLHHHIVGDPRWLGPKTQGHPTTFGTQRQLERGHVPIGCMKWIGRLIPAQIKLSK